MFVVKGAGGSTMVPCCLSRWAVCGCGIIERYCFAYGLPVSSRIGNIETYPIEARSHLNVLLPIEQVLSTSVDY